MNKTILCIDDAAPILQLYGRVFEEQGYKVILASNAWDGLDDQHTFFGKKCLC
jgi:DNA-binding NtrC family response regulator